MSSAKPTPARRPIRASKAAGKGEKNEDILPVTWPVDTSLDLSRRPMVGHDMERFRGRHQLQIADSIYALCIQNSAKYNEMMRRPVLPFTLELLIRLYDAHPGHAPWTTVTPQQAFEMLYGTVAREFDGTEYAKEVRLALYRRFTGAMGRSVYTAYRWVQGDGNAKSQVVKIFAKLAALKDPREVLESIAGVMYRTRREDLDLKFPLPSTDAPPQPKRRGPPPGARAARAAAALAAAAPRKAAPKKTAKTAVAKAKKTPAPAPARKASAAKKARASSRARG